MGKKPVCQPGEILKTDNVDSNKCKLCDTCIKKPCPELDCAPLTCDASLQSSKNDKDGCPMCPVCEKPPCPTLQCSKDLECKGKLVNNKDKNGCELCQTCEEPVKPEKPCEELKKDLCKLDGQIVDLYNSKFKLTRRLNLSMKKMAWKRCINHRQLQNVSKLSLNDNNPIDAEIKKKAAERKKLLEEVTSACSEDNFDNREEEESSSDENENENENEDEGDKDVPNSSSSDGDNNQTEINEDNNENVIDDKKKDQNDVQEEPKEEIKKDDKKDSDSALGSVYIQSLGLGAASYHIGNKASESYISYENAPSSWKRKDGSKPPAKKYFDNATYDTEKKTFKGTINWGQNTMSGFAKWEYEIIFSEDFETVKGGTVKLYDINNKLKTT